VAVRRTFVVIANTARADGAAPLDDLAGAGGRFDVVARFVAGALLTSHGMRRDTHCIVHFPNAPRKPRALLIDGGRAQGLRPDERTTASILNAVLARPAMPIWQELHTGISLRAVTLDDMLSGLPRPHAVLDEGGEPAEKMAAAPGTFLFGDHQGLTEDQLVLAHRHADTRVSLGPVSLQSDQAAVVLHNVLDRAGV
jgi:tRNA (pseudouridine54-N1)-methyltransferase